MFFFRKLSIFNRSDAKGILPLIVAIIFHCSEAAVFTLPIFNLPCFSFHYNQICKLLGFVNLSWG